MAAQQCSRCDTAAECVDQGLGRLEDIADVLGVPTPSLHVHLVQHDRDDVLSALTYGGKPIIEPVAPKVEETTVVVQDGPEPAADVVDQEGPEPVQSNDGQKAGHPDNSVGDEDDDTYDVPDRPLMVGRAGRHEQEPDYGNLLDFRAVLEGLGLSHPGEAVRIAATDLASAIDEWVCERADRQRLEELVAQRDDLNQQIDALAAKLGDLDPQPASQPRPVDPAAVRVWARSKGLNVAPTSKIARRIIDGYLAEVRP